MRATLYHISRHTLDFFRSLHQDTYQCNTQLRNSLEKSNPKEAILIYAQMNQRGVKIDTYSLVFAIKACGLMPGYPQGEQIHTQVLFMGFSSEIIIQTALLKMYGLFSDLVSAQKVFDETPHRDIVQWNALISSYLQNNRTQEAILAAQSMVKGNARPNEVTMVSVVSACCQVRALALGKLAHGYAIKNLKGFDTFVHNALIDMYAKCGFLSYARRLFDRMGSRSVVSWTSMINAYRDNDCPSEALRLFRDMNSAKVRLDEGIMIVLVSAGAKLCSVELGESIDEYVHRNGFSESTRIMNALIDMHSRCGDLKRSCEIFDHMENRTLVSWTAMIQGLAMHGHGAAALLRFSQMQREGFRPDELVFLSVLSACSHAGLVLEGKQCFISMVEEYSLVPWMEHHGSMMDLLCRAGLTSEAFEFAARMPMKPDGMILRKLAAACRDEGDLKSAERVVNYLIELEPEHSGNYIVKSNLHAMDEEWGNVREVRKGMGIKGVAKKDPGCSYIAGV